MTNAEKLQVAMDYFKHTKKYGPDQWGCFCAFCDYLKYCRDHGEIPASRWAEKDNVPDFGYKLNPDVKTPIYQMRPVYNNILVLCGEDFIDAIPTWQEAVGKDPIEIIPPEPKPTSMEEAMAKMMIDIVGLDKKVDNILNVLQTVLAKLNQLKGKKYDKV